MISTSPYKGTKDFYPNEMLIQNYIFDGWRKACLKHGFMEYQTPIIESAEIYRAKSGEDVGNKELYTFRDLGDRDLALRPEMTPSVTRMVSSKYKEMSKPIKLFSIGSFYRNEKPQKGRNREFWQLNADIFGDETIYSDIEVLLLAIDIMNEFNAPKSSYKININDRKLINSFLNIIGIKNEYKTEVIRTMDKFHKLTLPQFKDNLSKNINEQQINSILLFLNNDIQTLNSHFPGIENNEGFQNLSHILSIFNELKLDSNIKFNPSLVRGFDYYDGLVFEVNDNNLENPRSLFGGGRYNGLADIFGSQNFPAVGFAPGNETFRIFLENWNLIPNFNVLNKYPSSFIFAILDHSNPEITSKLQNQVFLISSEIRKLVPNLILDTSLQPKTTSAGLEFASKKNFDFCLIIGQDEIEKNTITIKKLSDGSQFNLSLHNLISYLQKNLPNEIS